MYKFIITVFVLVIVTMCAAGVCLLGGAEVFLIFAEFAVRVLFPALVLAVAGGVMVSQ
jgi:hypothetical protein